MWRGQAHPQALPLPSPTALTNDRTPPSSTAFPTPHKHTIPHNRPTTPPEPPARPRPRRLNQSHSLTHRCRRGAPCGTRTTASCRPPRRCSQSTARCPGRRGSRLQCREVRSGCTLSATGPPVRPPHAAHCSLTALLHTPLHTHCHSAHSTPHTHRCRCRAA